MKQLKKTSLGSKSPKQRMWPARKLDRERMESFLLDFLQRKKETRVPLTGTNKTVPTRYTERYEAQKKWVRERVLWSFPFQEKRLILQVLEKQTPKQIVEAWSDRNRLPRNESIREIRAVIDRSLKRLESIEKEYNKSAIGEVKDLYSNRVTPMSGQLQLLRLQLASLEKGK